MGVLRSNDFVKNHGHLMYTTLEAAIAATSPATTSGGTTTQTAVTDTSTSGGTTTQPAVTDTSATRLTASQNSNPAQVQSEHNDTETNTSI